MDVMASSNQFSGLLILPDVVGFIPLSDAMTRQLFTWDSPPGQTFRSRLNPLNSFDIPREQTDQTGRVSVTKIDQHLPTATLYLLLHLS